MSKKWVGISGIILAGVLALAANQPWNTVTEVIDGDTFRMANGQRVRLLAVDAPELEFCGGTEAKELLEKSVLGKKIILEEVRADYMGRVLALVVSEGKNVNEVLIKSGWGRWDRTKSRMGPNMEKFSDLAQQNKSGIWGKCRQTTKPDCLIKGNVEKENQPGQKSRMFYFFPGCSEYERTVVERELGEDWYCSEAEARAAGYAKGTNCYGKVWK
ncbi:MAG: thermonuclease family protein [Candidatus Shapirobacteria bacterium]